MEQSLQQKALDKIRSTNTIILNKPDSFIVKFLNSKKQVTVVTATYNAESYIKRTIDSVINQTLGFEKIQYIIVDDCSTDGTADIIRGYASRYKNICFVSLSENSGSPGLPRNIGIELANTKYIAFLDADDWLDSGGLKSLSSILQETGDDYVVGKTVKVENKGRSVIGEFASVKERRSVSPFSIPHFFYHMGPTARMMSLSLLKNHNIRFPEMKFGEDKLFFIGVFLNANAVSTTTAPIYYVNRAVENSKSLTRVTHVLDKRKADLKIINYIKSLTLNVEKEKVILNRLYEYDILKTFDSMLFLRSKQKEEFFELLTEAIATTEDLRYDFREEFMTPLYRRALDLFMQGWKEDFVELWKWFKYDKGKKQIIKDSLPYFEVPFLDDKEKLIRIPMLATALNSYIINNKYVQTFQVYGDFIDNINDVIIRDRTDFSNEIKCSFHVDGNFGQFQIDYDELGKLKNSMFTVFIRYNDYQLINIKRISSVPYVKNNKIFNFYTSKENNLSFALKENTK